MFLLVSVRHVGAHPGEHQHGVSIQISISLGKTFLRISRIRNIPLTRILARVFVYVPPFISQILDFIYWTVLIFILIYFEWRDTELKTSNKTPRGSPHIVSPSLKLKSSLQTLLVMGKSKQVKQAKDYRRKTTRVSQISLCLNFLICDAGLLF